MTTTSTPTRAMRLAAAASATYQRVFATSRVAPLLSRPRPVRRSGYDLDLTVRAIRAEADDVISLVLAAPDGSPLPGWIPGAHLDVFLPSGRQRQYSLCGDPGDRSSYRIAVRRIADGGGGSREIHDTVRAGGPLRIRGPRNAFPLAAANSYLFVAAGIGITPILPMVRACHERAVPWRLVYLGRSRATMPFLDELARCDSGTVEIRPDDECGPPVLGDILPLAPAGAAVYLCGPPPLMHPARELVRASDPSASLHTERFSPPPVSGGAPFEIRLRRTGVTVGVGPGETALTAITRVTSDVAYSCRQGFCGTCKVRVLDGEVEHRDRLLSPAERRDSMLVCVSRATGRLVIDR
ncbi:PDR/VanB family oxidoreductase [Amycolatopsis sp. DG1A-15b]|uniref:PDR/VanB family oxidoreductase n=1 Tax=Amycolatopsis sp. DG1A-15b TaxID=3052846 RepID=UPI00255BA587|nr:PDR/VanB family oxidoreductase [Amycolatopsis sp. DG1A-15b]WIX92407.1 PDR/VanB family oxidoreductase [Amycolatopsis sp. DG1A-15b]